MRLAALALSFLLATSTPGCIAIARHRQEVSLTSNVPGTQVEWNGERAELPCVLDVRTSSTPCMAVFTAPGCEPVTQEIQSAPYEWKLYSGGELFLGICDCVLLIPVIIDSIHRDCAFYWPQEIDVRLRLVGQAGDVWTRYTQDDPRRPMAVDPVKPDAPHPRAEPEPPPAAPRAGGVRSAGR